MKVSKKFKRRNFERKNSRARKSHRGKILGNGKSRPKKFMYQKIQAFQGLIGFLGSKIKKSRSKKNCTVKICRKKILQSPMIF